MDLLIRHIVLLLGATGYGKSKTAKELAELMERAIICDPKGEYGGGRVVRTPDELRAYYRTVFRGDRWKIICRGNDTIAAAFELCCRAMYRDAWLLVDEAHRFCGPTWADPNFLQLMTEGRHVRCSILAVSQRPQHLRPELRSYPDAVLTFRLRRKGDLKELEDFFDETEHIRSLPHDRFAYSIMADVPLLRAYLKKGGGKCRTIGPKRAQKKARKAVPE